MNEQWDHFHLPVDLLLFPDPETTQGWIGVTADGTSRYDSVVEVIQAYPGCCTLAYRTEDEDNENHE